MNLLKRLFRPQPDPREALRPLWHAVVAEARRPEWYARLGVPDTVTGRFDIISAVFALILLRMEQDGDLARDTSLLTELYIEDMDAQLREFGVGDIVVGKRITKLMGATGGRINAYFGGIQTGRDKMTDAVARNMSLPVPTAAQGVADALIGLWGRLARTDDAALLAGEIAP